MSTFKLSEAFKVATDAERNNPLRGVERVICETAPGPSLAFAEAATKAAMLDVQVRPLRTVTEMPSKVGMIDAQLAPLRGMTETLCKTMADAQLAPLRGMTETVSKVGMIDAQLAPLRGMTDIISKAGLGPSRGVIGAVIDAQLAPLRGMTETLFMSASPPSLGIDAALKAALSPSFGMMNQALFGGVADIVGKGAFGSISALGAIDVDQLVEKFSALATARNADASLERERIRQLWGYYIYVQVWIICLLVLVGAWKMDETLATLLGIGLSMTGWTGQSVASRARKIALDNFDRIYPPSSKMPPPITNILI